MTAVLLLSTPNWHSNYYNPIAITKRPDYRVSKHLKASHPSQTSTYGQLISTYESAIAHNSQSARVNRRRATKPTETLENWRCRMLKQLPLFVTRAGAQGELVYVDMDPTNGEKLAIFLKHPGPSPLSPASVQDLTSNHALNHHINLIKAPHTRTLILEALKRDAGYRMPYKGVLTVVVTKELHDTTFVDPRVGKRGGVRRDAWHVTARVNAWKTCHFYVDERRERVVRVTVRRE